MTNKSQILHWFTLTIFGVVCFFQLCNVSGFKCGKINISRPLIQDGNPALRGEWPFIAALHKVHESRRYFCGGTLITNQHVLTAAHCVSQKTSPHKLLPSDLTVRLGAHNITAKSEIGMIERNVTEILIHPQWDVYVIQYDSDIAILVLNGFVTFTNYIQPICMPDDVVVDGVLAAIVGWGISKNGNIAETPQFAVTKVLNDSYCYRKDPAITIFSSPNTFCGGEGDGTPNKGDSGGGIFAVSNSSWVQYGIISSVRTNETGHVMPNSFAVYTNLNSFKSWIIESAQGYDDTKILNCYYGGPIFMFLRPYTCWLNNLNIRVKNVEIISVAGSYHTGRTDQDVEVIQFYNGTMLYLPNGIGKYFKNVKRLIVGQDLLSSLGTKLISRLNFKDLTKLIDLAIWRNDIDELEEDSLWDLLNLEKFRLTMNKLKTLHERTFEKNLKLKELIMNSNQLNFLPRNLLKNNLLLESVNFSNNSLKTMHEKTFETNVKLKVLKLSRNQLKILPMQIFSQNLLLQSVSLSKNAIESLDENVFKNNVKLSTISIESNLLEFLPRNLFKNNPSILWLDVSNNSLKIIEIDFTELTNIRHLYVQDNICLRQGGQNVTELQLLITANCQPKSETEQIAFLKISQTSQIAPNQSLV